MGGLGGQDQFGRRAHNKDDPCRVLLGGGSHRFSQGAEIRGLRGGESGGPFLVIRRERELGRSPFTLKQTRPKGSRKKETTGIKDY